MLLEGNLAAGKTTLLRELQAQYHCIVKEEPSVNNPYLAKFYADPVKYGYSFQLWFLNLRINNYKEACELAEKNPNSFVILDRSLYSDYVFALNGHIGGIIND